MKKYWIIISLAFILGCEKIVIIELPPAQNLVVVEGWVTDIVQTQTIRLIVSNGFLSENPVQPIENAAIRVERRNGGFQLYEYSENGYYSSENPYAANADLDYRVVIDLANGDQIRSEWSKMPRKAEILATNIRSYEENDPDNPGQQITLYYPKMIVRDSANFSNYYRWVFFQGKERRTLPESITLQDDRFFDGNLVPNTFDEFSYERGDSIIVNLQSISNNSFSYLTLLKSQIATLGSSSIAIPAVVDGNLTNFSADEKVLGHFGAIAISADTLIAN